MTTRNYSSTAAATTLNGAINDSVTSMVVAATTGFPAANFVLAIDPDTVTQELVLVTNVAGTTLTITRGYDSTSAVAHSAGAVVQHAHAAIDFRESRTHEAATSGVHGVTGSFVGTTDTQALTNKTLGSTNTVNGFTADRLMKSDATGKLAASTLVLPTSAVLGLTDVQAPTNKDLSSGTNTFPASLCTDAELATHAALTATHGATGAVVGTTNAQTLTNKTLTSPTINTPTITSPTVTGAGQVLRVLKGSDESVTSSTVLQNDNELLFAAAAGASYIFELTLLFNAASSAIDAKVAFAFPTGTLAFGVIGLDPATVGGNTGDVQAGGTASATSGTTAVSVGVSSSAATTVVVTGSFVATNAGNVILMWAQDNSTASAMTLKAGSYLRAERVS